MESKNYRDDCQIVQKNYRLIVLLKSGLYIFLPNVYPIFEIAETFAEKIKNGEVLLEENTEKRKCVVKSKNIVEIQIYEETLIRQNVFFNNSGKIKRKIGFPIPQKNEAGSPPKSGN